jgi:hypothetical protein
MGLIITYLKGGFGGATEVGNKTGPFFAERSRKYSELLYFLLNQTHSFLALARQNNESREKISELDKNYYA